MENVVTHQEPALQLICNPVDACWFFMTTFKNAGTAQSMPDDPVVEPLAHHHALLSLSYHVCRRAAERLPMPKPLHAFYLHELIN